MLILAGCAVVGAAIFFVGILATLLPEKFDDFCSRALGDGYMLGVAPASRVSIWRNVGVIALIFDLVVLLAFVVLVFARLMTVTPT